MKRGASDGVALAATGVVYLILLVVTGEFYWGSNAMFLFGSIWSLQAIVFVWRSMRHDPNNSRGESAREDSSERVSVPNNGAGA